LRQPLRIATLCGFSAIIFAAGSEVPGSPVSADDGLPDLVKKMRREGCCAGNVILIAGPTGGANGRIIASFAESLPYRPREILVRALKVLAQSDWNGGHYACRFNSPDQVIRELDSEGVSAIALDVSQRWGPWWPDQELLVSAIERYPDRAKLVYSSNQSIYRLYSFSSKTPPHVPDRLLNNLEKVVGNFSF
jgi:hypothetical protein